jgi:hypothetical protein
MANAVPMARSRGSLSGLALILLGAWGGLMLFIGPYFHFGYTPDKTWVYDTGRLYAAIVPGGVALLAGLVVLATKSRWFAATCASIAVLAGVWFVVGREVLDIAVSNPNAYAVGAPIGALSLHRAVATNLATFTGVGLLIVLFAALALGRVSVGAYKDFVRFGDATGGAAGAVGGGLASVGLGSASPSYGSASPSFTPYQPTSVSPFPPAEEPVVGGQAKFPTQYPAAGEDTVAQSGASTNPFTPGQVTYSPGQTRYPPTQEQTNPLTAPAQEQKFPPGQ